MAMITTGASLPLRFELHRRYDVNGVSGTGTIAFGTLYPSGRVTLAWCSDVRSVTVYDDVAEVEKIHGHGGLTDIRWIDAAPASVVEAPPGRLATTTSIKGDVRA